MSEYIYGSSLRAAKSKANYLFEGDFRRRPSQNLSGASRSLARGELLQQAAEQRQNREDIRRREQASVKIQSHWRGHRCRKCGALKMRTEFDNMIKTVSLNQQSLDLDLYTLDTVMREFIIFYHSQLDASRFLQLIDILLHSRPMTSTMRQHDTKIWLHRMVKLLTMNLAPLTNCEPPEIRMRLRFLEQYTRLNESVNNLESVMVWHALIEHKLYTIFRRLVSRIHGQDMANDASLRDLSQSLIELTRRSLSIDLGEESSIDNRPVRAFFIEFLRGPLDGPLESLYFPELLRLQPSGLRPISILAEFGRELGSSSNSFGNTNAVAINKSDQVQQSTDAIWLCYCFVKSIYTHISQLDDSQRVQYIRILASLMAPASYITSLTSMQTASNQDLDYNSEQPDDEMDPSISKTNQTCFYYTEINSVITRLVNIVNDSAHIGVLKTIIFNPDIQGQVLSAIVQICNLMLAHEPLAIFNCRLLYTVAFSKEFSRNLWKSIIATNSTTLYGTNTPIYLQLTRGNNVSQESWSTILPKLKLFCSLYSYLLPTIDDEEFYSDPDDVVLLKDRDQNLSERHQQAHGSGGGSFFIDKDLIIIGAILRDLCVGLIEVLYNDNRQSYQRSSLGFDIGFHDDRSKLLSFEIKESFKALVRLVRQLHARDSRKQFCPDGHWICPSVVIPANRVIDFQLLAGQQGRLLSQMTKDELTSDRTVTTPSEIKTLLILQEIPFIISFHDRVQIFHHLLRKEKHIHQSEGYNFGLPGTAIQVQIRRNYLYEDAFEKLSNENEPNMKLPLKVSLINEVGAEEAGIDGGGLTKEFLSELLKAGFDPMRGFFKSTTDQLLYPNPSANVLFSNLADSFEVHYEFLGRMLGKAIFEKIMVELPMASFFLAKLLARKHSSDVDLHNLASLDPVLYKNLVYLKNYRSDVANLNLDFTISNNELGEHEMVELKPGGSKIPVTRENKIEYVHLVADYRLNKQIRAQCAAFKRGLSQLIELDWLRMFDPRELQILISGAPVQIDTADWRRHTLYANGYSDDCEPINAFWRVVDQFDENQKRKLLKFATSCSLAPLLGFKDLVPQFTIAPSEESRLPTASTCMNLLKLPQCEDDKTMRSKLLYAIESNSGFELS